MVATATVNDGIKNHAGFAHCGKLLIFNIKMEKPGVSMLIRAKPPLLKVYAESPRRLRNGHQRRP
jgi:hypothetical protein